MKSISAFVVAVRAGMCSLCVSANAQAVDVSVQAGCFQPNMSCDYFFSVTNNIGGDYRISEFVTIAAGFPIGTPPGWTGVPFGPVWTADDYDTAIATGQSGGFAYQEGGSTPNTSVLWSALAEGDPSKDEPNLFFSGAAPTVPEPSTWAMMLLGFAGLGFMGYRARRKTRAA
jgi:PEP-CTERM motif